MSRARSVGHALLGGLRWKNSPHPNRGVHSHRTIQWPHLLLSCRGKPLKGVTEETGEQWGRPSPGVEIKSAAIKVPCTAHVQLLHLRA